MESTKKVTKKPSAEKASTEKMAPVKLVPAPPPKENIWEKRKSENQASRQQQSSTSVESASEGTAADKQEENTAPAETKTPAVSVSTASQCEETAAREKVCYCYFKQMATVS